LRKWVRAMNGLGINTAFSDTASVYGKAVHAVKEILA
jgi:hypothetical protein